MDKGEGGGTMLFLSFFVCGTFEYMFGSMLPISSNTKETLYYYKCFGYCCLFPLMNHFAKKKILQKLYLMFFYGVKSLVPISDNYLKCNQVQYSLHFI